MAVSRLRGVEGLRALAAGSIVVYHVWLYSAPDGEAFALGAFSRFAFPHLPVGVTLFFTLSGFLLYRPFAAAALNGTALPNLRRYFGNRALRIFPAYWVILLAASVLLPAALVRAGGDFTLGRFVDTPTVLLRNALLLHNYFPDSMDTGIGPTWSLAVELGFSLALPLLGWLGVVAALRFANRRTRATCTLLPALLILGVGLASKALAVSLVAPETGLAHDVLVRSFGYHADMFALGMALAVVRVQVEDGSWRLPSWWRLPALGALVVLVPATVWLTDRGLVSRWDLFASYDRLTALACGLLLALVVLPGRGTAPPLLVRLLEGRALVGVGLASYSLFLWHEPLIRLLQHWGLTVSGAFGFVVNLLLAGAVSGALAALTYRYVERPALRLKSHRERTARDTDPSEGSTAPAVP